MNEELLKRLDALAAKLGTTGEQVWAILVKQARIEAITHALGGLAFAALIFYAIKKLWAWGRDESYREFETGFGTILLGIALLFAAALVAEIRWYFMPEAWALQQILRAVN